MSEVRKFFSEAEEAQIIETIREAELKTSGEIRVHIEEKCKGDSLERAIKVFHELKMDTTDLQNGVLFYIATNDHKFSIVGDQGIDNKVPDDFWDHIRDVLKEHFIKAEFAKGLSKGIAMAGKALAEYFPYQEGDVNELPDNISTS